MVKLDGSSEVNIVALEGDMRYLALSVEMIASFSPISPKHVNGLKNAAVARLEKSNEKSSCQIYP